jgi:hypothetical protein
MGHSRDRVRVPTHRRPTRIFPRGRTHQQKGGRLNQAAIRPAKIEPWSSFGAWAIRRAMQRAWAQISALVSSHISEWHRWVSERWARFATISNCPTTTGPDSGFVLTRFCVEISVGSRTEFPNRVWCRVISLRSGPDLIGARIRTINRRFDATARQHITEMVTGRRQPSS